MGTVRVLWRLLMLASGLRIADQAPRRLRSEGVAMVLEVVVLGVVDEDGERRGILSIPVLVKTLWSTGERS
jgi:hypothetical protein